jgi:hypothetical protein
LESILAPCPCGSSPCIDPIFGPTGTAQTDPFSLSRSYWSSSTDLSCISQTGAGCAAWTVSFADGSVDSLFKTSLASSGYARAVRDGP